MMISCEKGSEGRRSNEEERVKKIRGEEARGRDGMHRVWNRK